MSRKIEVATYDSREQGKGGIIKKPGFWATLAGLLLCLVCIVPVLGGVLIAEGAAVKLLEGELLLIVGALILVGGIIATIMVYKKHKRKSSCKSEGEGQSCSV